MDRSGSFYVVLVLIMVIALLLGCGKVEVENIVRYLI